ncbi:undecaprenyl-diphosphate phosphatase [bacterium]|nr:undecaprenyl-diphosphate phosphatase [candidate division CSSED10-310 bacterium]
MTMLHAIILGIIQGITEFLPISSSGHLVLVQSILPRFSAPGLVFDIILHAGTLVAVLFYYAQDITRFAKGIAGKLPPEENRSVRSWLIALAVATVPAGIVAASVGDIIESMFENPAMTSVFLGFTGLILFWGERMKSAHPDRSASEHRIPWRMALIIGLAQALALLPGISRSGMTMAAGIALGLPRETATRFSFLLMIPAVAGAVALKSLEIPSLISTGTVGYSELAVGFVASAIAGYLAITGLLRLIKKYTFNVFAVYCLIAGTASLLALTAH